MKRSIFALLLLATTSLVGCGRGFNVATPAGFAELEDQDKYGYRATNAEGVVLGVRREANAPVGDLAFWSGAVDAHLRRSGYEAVSAHDVQTEDGVAGRQIRYRRQRNGREHVFWVTVFVTEDVVMTVEVGGDHEHFEDHQKQINAAIKSLTIG